MHQNSILELVDYIRHMSEVLEKQVHELVEGPDSCGLLESRMRRIERGFDDLNGDIKALREKIQ